MPLYLRILVTVILSVCLRVNADNGNLEPQPVHEYDQLSPQAKLNLVLAMLDARDHSLRNISLKVRESHLPVDPRTGELKLIRVHTDEIRRLDNVVWMHAVIRDIEGNEARTSMEFIVNWNGRTARGLDLLNGEKTKFGGSVAESERGNFATCKYLQLLGSHMAIGSSVMSVRDWVRDAVNSGIKPEITEESHNGMNSLHLLITQGDWKREYWFDPHRQFMIIGYRQVFGDNLGSAIIEVEESIKQDGIWLPARAIRRSRTDATSKFNEMAYELLRFSVGGVTPRDVDVQFPVGTGVVDRILNISYRVLPNGKFELYSLANGAGHIVRRPPQNRIVDRIDATVAGLYSTAPLHTGPPTLNGRGDVSARWVRRLLAGITFCAGALAFLLWARRRRRSAKT